MSIPIRTIESDDIVMSSLEESSSVLDCNLTTATSTVSSMSSLAKMYSPTTYSVECPRSEDEDFVDQPSTSSATPQVLGTAPTTAFQPYMNQNRTIDPILQEMLLSSPSHLFNVGLLPADALVSSWEQWLCLLASNLTPTQWQNYWNAYATVFGVASVPVHLLSFFRQSLPNQTIDYAYGIDTTNNQYAYYS